MQRIWGDEMKKGLLASLMVILFLILLSNCGAWSAVPPIPHTLLMDKPDRYVLDAVQSPLIGNPLASIANAMFYIYKLIIKIMIKLMLLSYKLDVFDLIGSELDTMIIPLKNSLFDGLLPIGIGFFVLYVLFGMGRGRNSEAFGEVIKIVMVLAFALWFLLSPSKSINTLRGTVLSVNNDIILNTYVKSYDAENVDEALDILADQYWENYVVEYWRILNFSETGKDDDYTETAKKYEKDLLNQSPGSIQRNEITERLREEVPNNEAFWMAQIFIMQLLTLPDVALNLVLGIVNIGSSGLVIFIVFLGPLIFVLCLFPHYGIRMFYNWLSKIIFFLSIVIFVTLILTFYLALNERLIAIKTRQNLTMTDILLFKMGVIVTLYLFRDKIISLFIGIRHGARGMERAMAYKANPSERVSKDFQMVGYGMEHVRSGRSMLEKIPSRKEDFLLSIDGKTTGRNLRKKSSEFGLATESTTLKPNKVWNTMTQEEKTELARRKLYAEYENEKHSAELEASRKSEVYGSRIEPTYSSRVLEKQVIISRNLGDAFSPSEIAEMVQKLNKFEQDGGEAHSYLGNDNHVEEATYKTKPRTMAKYKPSVDESSKKIKVEHTIKDQTRKGGEQEPKDSEKAVYLKDVASKRKRTAESSADSSNEKKAGTKKLFDSDELKQQKDIDELKDEIKSNANDVKRNNEEIKQVLTELSGQKMNSNGKRGTIKNEDTVNLKEVASKKKRTPSATSISKANAKKLFESDELKQQRMFDELKDEVRNIGRDVKGNKDEVKQALTELNEKEGYSNRKQRKETSEKKEKGKADH